MRSRRLNPGTVVVVVRNPWDRLVSTWAYYLRRKKSWCPTDFGDFVRDTSWGNAKRLQTSFYTPSETIVLRFENLTTEFSQIQKLAGVHEPLGVKNRSDHKHYTELYTAETRDIVAQRHMKDINLLGYSYGD